MTVRFDSNGRNRLRCQKSEILQVRLLTYGVKLTAAHAGGH
jgi:hypothetical protein